MFANVGEESKAERRSSTGWQCQWQAGGFTHIGGRDHQEDRGVVIPDFNKWIPANVQADRSVKRAFFAVYDGHGGDHCATILSRQFHKRLAQHPLIGVDPKTALSFTWQVVETDIYRAFVEKFENDFRANGSGIFPPDGSTASVCLIVGDMAYFANCGDSSMICIQRNNDILQVAELHNTSNREELRRIRAVGGRVVRRPFNVRGMLKVWGSRHVHVRRPRVYPGGLLVTRAFGDFVCKIPQLGGMMDTIVPNHGEIKEVNLQGIVSIVLASDGLWDAIPAKRIPRLLQNMKTDCMSLGVTREDTNPSFGTADNFGAKIGRHATMRRGRRQSVDHPTVYQSATGIHITDGDEQRSEDDPIAFDPWQAFPLSASEERISNFEPFKSSPASVRPSEVNDSTREVDLIASRHDLGTLQCAAAKALCTAAVRSKYWNGSPAGCDNTTVILIDLW